MTFNRDLANKANDKSVVQVVSATYSTLTSSTSTTYADTGLTASITPTSASNKILVIVSQNGVNKAAGNTETSVAIKLLRGASDLIILGADDAYTGTSLQTSIGSVSSVYLDSPNTTSSTTYKTQFKTTVSGQTVKVQLASATSSICLIEVVG